MSDQSKRLLKWLLPGLGVKRWLISIFIGALLLGLSAALLLVELYRARPPIIWEYLMNVPRLPLWLIGLLAGVGGGLVVLLSVMRINRSILEPLEVDTPELLDAIVENNQRKRGPKIVAIGGGTGMPTLLRGLKLVTSNITAVVTVADDGGSSGKLRRDMGVLPPGDLRNNIAALARDENLMTQLFQYRFGSGLEGHSFGNLFITALSAVTGSFEQALAESSRVLAVRGQVLPSTLDDVTLTAEIREAEGTRQVVGEAAIPKTMGAVQRVVLQPENARAYPAAVQAILTADVIIIGPGSLYTSIIPNLLIEGITAAIRASKARTIYICNVATQHGETDNFSVEDHVSAIERHTGPGLIDVVLINGYFPPLEADANYDFVRVAGEPVRYKVHPARVIDDEQPWRHDPQRLVEAILHLLNQTG